MPQHVPFGESSSVQQPGFGIVSGHWPQHSPVDSEGVAAAGRAAEQHSQLELHTACNGIARAVRQRSTFVVDLLKSIMTAKIQIRGEIRLLLSASKDTY